MDPYSSPYILPNSIPPFPTKSQTVIWSKDFGFGASFKGATKVPIRILEGRSRGFLGFGISGFRG